jgi:hypothetical protein
LKSRLHQPPDETLFKKTRDSRPKCSQFRPTQKVGAIGAEKTPPIALAGLLTTQIGVTVSWEVTPLSESIAPGAPLIRAKYQSLLDDPVSESVTPSSVTRGAR